MPVAGVTVPANFRVDKIEPVDHHQPKAIEQCDDRKQERIGVGREALMARCAIPKRVKNASP